MTAMARTVLEYGSLLIRSMYTLTVSRYLIMTAQAPFLWSTAVMAYIRYNERM